MKNLIVVLTLTCCAAVALAADVTRPAEVTGLKVRKSAGDLIVDWNSVTLDAAGNAETVNHYNVYRGTTPDFVPDRNAGSNRVGTPSGASFTDAGAASNGSNYFYLVTAVDAAGNESSTKPSLVLTPPTLSGNWTETTIDLTWNDAQPLGQVVGYRVYYGTASHRYDFVDSVGLAHSDSLHVATNTMWYSAVVAVDSFGNESSFSNEWVDVVAGKIKMKAHDDDYICWGAGGCPPKPGRIQRNDGFQIMAPIDFPPGSWKNVKVTYTLDSRLCSNVPDKCGPNNPGGYNPCGDPWDRTAHLFLVLDNCLDGTGSCITPNNLELMRAITPFGTDAPPPNGTGKVPPRVLTLDITPYLPLLSGHKYIGAEIGNYVQSGWHVTSEFTFSKRNEDVTSKKPAEHVEVLTFGGLPMTAKQVSIPSGVTKTYIRLFTTGHGGTQYCDGGSNNGGSCTSNTQCPGGSCQNCDEFCHRTNQILVDNNPAWQAVPWRSDCSPASVFDCQNWNACGWPSCTFSRAGWCPGYIACHANAPCDQDLDMTSSFPAGNHTVNYNVLVNRGSWTVSMVLFYYKN